MARATERTTKRRNSVRESTSPPSRQPVAPPEPRRSETKRPRAAPPPPSPARSKRRPDADESMSALAVAEGDRVLVLGKYAGVRLRLCNFASVAPTTN
jgi:hypothetical protein